MGIKSQKVQNNLEINEILLKHCYKKINPNYTPYSKTFANPNSDCIRFLLADIANS